MCYYVYVFVRVCVLQQVRVAATKGDKNAELSPLQMFSFFVNRCREKLHVMIAFSPIGDAFRTRLRQYPSLINCCTIDWFQATFFLSLTFICRSFSFRSFLSFQYRFILVFFKYLTICFKSFFLQDLYLHYLSRS